MPRPLKTVLMTAAEFALLLLLWEAFVSNGSKLELLVGVVAAAVGAIGDAVVKSEDLAKFKPKPSWLALIFWEPWYVLKGNWVVIRTFFARLVGKPANSGFVAKDYTGARSKDARTSAKRALAVSYLTIPPNSIIVGIDADQEQVLLHQLAPEPVSVMAQKLGISK